MDYIPNCPICGKPMVDRVARHGANAGNHFWGCSDFPTCRGTIDSCADTDEASRSIFGTGSKVTDIRFSARARHSSDDVRFHQGIAVPYHVLEEINQDDSLRTNYIYTGHWRMDFPYLAMDADPKMRFLANQLRKLLKRGKITLLTQSLEDEIYKMFSDATLSTDQVRPSLFGYIDPPRTLNIELDGDGSEQIFYWEILPALLGSHFYQHVTPQVLHHSFAQTESEDGETRLDFLIALSNRCIAVEIDDESHSDHIERDRVRDSILSTSGIDTFRIPVAEIIRRSGPNLNKVLDIISTEKSMNDTSDKASISAWAIKCSYQIQSALIEAFDRGLIHKPGTIVAVNFNTPYIDKKHRTLLLRAICNDFIDQATMMERLYGLDFYELIDYIELVDSDITTGDITITYQTDQMAQNPTITLQDLYLPFQITDPCPVIEPMPVEDSGVDVLTFFLRYLFRKDAFLEGQYETLDRILHNKDTIVLLPTGAGKSIAFQLAALLLPGVALAVDPIIALIQDQIDNLTRIGIDRVNGITSDVKNQDDRNSILNLFGVGEYLMFYVSPERFQMKNFRSSIREASYTRPISLVAIDEAHCVSEWGHDFRTSYLNLGRIIREYCLNDGKPACIAALTGTASSAVLHDVQRELQITTYDAIVTPKTFDRRELRFDVIAASSHDKKVAVSAIMNNKLPDYFHSNATSFYQSRGAGTNCGIVFCLHVEGDYGIFKVEQVIRARAHVTTGVYAGSTPNRVTDEIWRERKRITARGFKDNKFPVLIATSAFGMGIDKANIRYTIHYGLPKSPEAFYQEAGRAGRDHKASICYLVVSDDHKERNQKLLDFKVSTREIREAINKEERDTEDDVGRVLYFHTIAFPGEEEELRSARAVLSRLRNGIPGRPISIPFSFTSDTKERSGIEKTIHRLVILGIVEDYTVNYGSKEFDIILGVKDKEYIISKYLNYVHGYNRGRVVREDKKIRQSIDLPFEQFVEKSFSVLVSFIYDTIEKGRRRALAEMLAIANQAVAARDKDNVVRKRIIQYFETHHSADIEEVLVSNDTGFDKVKHILIGEETADGELVGEIRSPNEAAELRGEVSRSLESTPDHPGLLILRALSELMCSDVSSDMVILNLKSAFEAATEHYEVSQHAIYDMLSFSANLIFEKRPDLYEEIIVSLLTSINRIDFAQHLVASAENEDMITEPAAYIWDDLAMCAMKTIHI